MATTPEGKVKLKLDNWLKANMPECFRFRVPGGPFGQVGMGDYILVYLGVPIMIEVKADETKDATDKQKLQLKAFNEAGGISCILKGFQEFKLQYIKQQCELRQLREQLNTPNSGNFSGSDEYNIWFRTRQKCTNLKHSSYAVYGGVGISMCDEWLNDFSQFYEDLGPRPTLLHTLDRLDNDKGYCKNNCRWATKEEQANNKKNIKQYSYNGVTGSLTQLARQFGRVQPDLVVSRVCQYGWDIVSAIEEPLYGGNRTRHKV